MYACEYSIFGRTNVVTERSKPIILVVDDQTTVVRVMGRMLSQQYIVHVATTGERALEIAEGQQPDLILLDMVMPGMDGLEVCQRLKLNPATHHIPVIFVTSMDDKHHEANGFKVGAVDYIGKPPSQEVMHARVALHLALSRQTKFIDAIANGQLEASEEVVSLAKMLVKGE
ncbi:MAG: putative two-component system response regulator [Candidatus Pseudothioglobus sp.]|jgi:putative two-component system response regulator